MNDNLSITLKEELLNIRKKKLQESLSILEDIEDKDFFIRQYIITAGHLLDEGYEMEEIELLSEGFFDKITQGIGSVAGDVWNSTNVFDSLISGGLGTIKEQVIRWLLTQLGVGKGAANFFAAFLEQTDPRELLRVFKSPEMCRAGMPKISDGLMAGTVRYLQFGESGVGLNMADQGKSALGNILDEVITQSNIGETVADKLCKAIW